MEYNKRNIFLQKLCRKLGRETSSTPVFKFKKKLIWSENQWSATKSQYISIALNLPYSKNKLYKTLDYWSRDMLNFNFSEKVLGLVSPPHFAYDFSRKRFFILHFINCLNFIVWLPLLFEILDYIYIYIYILQLLFSQDVTL